MASEHFALWASGSQDATFRESKAETQRGSPISTASMVPLYLITIIGMTVLALASSLALYFAIRNASIGYEDGSGFHGEMMPLGTPATPVERSHFPQAVGAK